MKAYSKTILVFAYWQQVQGYSRFNWLGFVGMRAHVRGCEKVHGAHCPSYIPATLLAHACQSCSCSGARMDPRYEALFGQLACLQERVAALELAVHCPSKQLKTAQEDRPLQATSSKTVNQQHNNCTAPQDASTGDAWRAQALSGQIVVVEPFLFDPMPSQAQAVLSQVSFCQWRKWDILRSSTREQASYAGPSCTCTSKHAT